MITRLAKFKLFLEKVNGPLHIPAMPEESYVEMEGKPLSACTKQILDWLDMHIPASINLKNSEILVHADDDETLAWCIHGISMWLSSHGIKHELGHNTITVEENSTIMRPVPGYADHPATA